VKLLAEPGVSIRTICKECHVSDHTVRSVADREQISIATVKKEVLSNITHGLRLASERVIEIMPDASAKDAVLGVGILTEKMQLLSGEATMRVEEPKRVDIFADFSEFLKNLEVEAAREQAVRNVHSETGLAGRNFSQKALINGDHQQPGDDEQPCDAGNGARNAVIDADAKEMLKESAKGTLADVLRMSEGHYGVD
jgi:hypothetical protein